MWLVSPSGLLCIYFASPSIMGRVFLGAVWGGECIVSLPYGKSCRNYPHPHPRRASSQNRRKMPPYALN